MKRILALAAVLLAVLAPAARAELPPPPPPLAGSPAGGCGYDSIAQQDVTGSQDTFVGAMWGYALLWDKTTLAPVGATIRCDLRVNGEVVDSTPEVHGTGFATTAGDITFVLGDTDVLDACLHVVFDDGRTVDCAPQPCEHLGNIEYFDCESATVDWAIGILQPAFDVAEPAMCGALAALAPGYGPVRIEPGGDVYLDDWFLVDCPPYA